MRLLLNGDNIALLTTISQFIFLNPNKVEIVFF